MVRNFSNEPDANLIPALRRIESAALLIAAAIAVTILFLWFIPAWDGYFPHIWSKMTANSACGLLLAACSLALTRQHFSRLDHYFGMALAIFVLLLGIASSLEYAIGVSFHIDTLLPHNSHGLHPGRPSPQTAFALILLGICMLTSRQAKSAFSRFADIAALALVAFSFVMLGGEFFGALDLLGIENHTLMSPQTLLAFFCFSTVAVFRRAEWGDVLAVLVNIGIGSRIIRLILPVAMFMPFVLLAVEAYFFKSGLMSEAYAQAVTAAAAATLVLCLMSWMGWRINMLERDLRDLSLTDELTAVCNRRGFYFLGQQAVREAQRANSSLSLFFFDVDGLKHVNDMFGHDAGSEMIKGFAGILTSTFRKSDIIGRVGGDEFAVITIRDEAMWIESVYTRLNAFTEAHNMDDSRAYRLSFSTGYAELKPGHGETLDSIVTRADGLMYQDKARKKKLAA